MSIACAVLMCHAPIVIPKIAGEHAARCAQTTAAMQQSARTLVEHEPQLVVLVSPHTPRLRHGWGICHDASLHGSFARFGHRELALAFHGAPAAAQTLAAQAAAQRLVTQPVSGRDLDHGALVPLHFLRDAGYVGPVLLIALPFPGTAPGHRSELAFGAAIRAAAAERAERWAVLASGDMSHRLTTEAPNGFDPAGPEFDRSFVTHLRGGDLRSAIALPDELVERAGEDVVQSTAVAAGAIDFDSSGARTLHYEGPFGVGYCEAVLFSALSSTRTQRGTASGKASQPPAQLAELALTAIEKHLTGAPLELPELAPPWSDPRAVFVTLRSPEGDLRGCIGRTEPMLPSLAAEVADCAVGAATRDFRMPSVTSDELPTLQVEVSVLSPPEPVESSSQLAPQHYGVIVSAGRRRGVLLPAIPSIDTAEQQLAIALQKAGIAPDEPYDLARFTVDKVVREAS